jgi:hypothetical protein
MKSLTPITPLAALLAFAGVAGLGAGPSDTAEDSGATPAPEYITAPVVSETPAPFYPPAPSYPDAETPEPWEPRPRMGHEQSIPGRGFQPSAPTYQVLPPQTSYPVPIYQAPTVQAPSYQPPSYQVPGQATSPVRVQYNFAPTQQIPGYQGTWQGHSEQDEQREGGYRRPTPTRHLPTPEIPGYGQPIQLPPSAPVWTPESGHATSPPPSEPPPSSETVD